MGNRIEGMLQRIFKGYTGTTYQPPRLDGSTFSIKTISYEHSEVHSGSHYFVNMYASLSLNNVLDFTWQMPNTTKWIHWDFTVDTESEMQLFVYEDAVATNPLANTMTPLNNNRNSANTSATTMLYELQSNLTAANADTDVTTATPILASIAGSGKLGGVTLRSSELIMKQNALYCMRAIANSAGYINFNMQWYEHTDRE